MSFSSPRAFKAILLDFYGTVVEEDDVYISDICQQIAKVSPHKPTPSEIGSYWSMLFKQMCADSFGDAFLSQKEIEQRSLEFVLQYFQVDLDSTTFTKMLFAYWSKPTIFSESHVVLKQCELPICLVSNIDNAELKSALEHIGLSFEWIVTSEDCQAYKPRPEMFEQALSIMGLDRSNVLLVGDSLGSDVQGAKAFGIPVLWINRNNRLVPLNNTPDYVANNLTGLIELL